MSGPVSIIVSLVLVVASVNQPEPGADQPAPVAEPAPTNTTEAIPVEPQPAPVDGQPQPAPVDGQPQPQPQPYGQPQPAPYGQPQPYGQPPPPQAQQPVPQPTHTGPSADPVLLAKGIKETVMGGVFLGFGAPLIALGVPLIVAGAENERLNDDSSKGALQIAGGAVATGFGGMFTLFALVLLPTGISKIVRSKRGYSLNRTPRSFVFNRTPRGTWTAGIGLQF